ncbi:hypothetical protein F444_16505 [Phytophthora nicotianae P1976]|uniref:Integrase catalytic domain-containing protein n=1 Tax=Phytophthora nicotianae P1976 TaxID=1317066 RepID=A0A080ZHZ5_PHYNI|nr:hypothetical protein F444_16505 [Phytophthora nicotianae P1976]
MTKTRAQSSVLPDGEAERGPAPIFAPIVPPRITKTSHAALVKWRKERREYEDTIRNRAKGDTDDLIVSIKNTFDEGLLREWCRLRWKVSIDDVTGSIILEEIEKIISSVKNNSAPDIDLEMAENLHMDLSESDVHERVIQYFKICREIIEDHEWNIFFTGPDGTKQLCSILIKSLEPKALREEVDRTARFQVRKAREDEVILHELILEKALDHEKAFQNQRRAKRDRDRGDREPDRAFVRTGSKKPIKKPRLADVTSTTGSQPVTKATDRPKVPPTPCPHCGDVHWLSECPTATDSKKAEIRKKLRAQRGEKSKREVARLKRLRECIPNEEKTVILNEVMELPYCADKLSRWASQPTTTVRLKRFTSKKAKKQRTVTTTEVKQALRPLDEENFTWPTLNEFKETQQQHQPIAGAVRGADDVLRVNKRIWIPRAWVDLTQRLCVIAHCGAQGHRGEQAMVNHLRRLFHIPDIRGVVHTYVSTCLLRPHVKGGKMIRRPWGETIECNERNGVLHWDFLSPGESFGDSKYLLVLKDHATHFCELVVCDAADSAVATAAILDWHSRFGAPPVWVSGNGSHFKNEVVAELSKRLKSQQNFILAYCPWINGSVERVNRDILQVLRVMTLEYKVSTKDWEYLVPLVQASLNHTALPSLGNRAPVELFTGLQCPSPLAEFYHPGSKKLVIVPKNSDAIDKHLAQLRQSLCTMHQPIVDQRLKQRDYVLRSRVDEKKRNKLLVTWQGPYRVVRADVHSFRIRHLVTGCELDVHESRLKFYADKNLNVTEEILEHVASQGIILAINELKKHRWNKSIKDYEVLVNWKGLESVEDSWELLTSLAKEVHVLLNQCIQKQGSKLPTYWKDYQSKFQ